MNAVGNNMLHIHSDEEAKWSAEILSSGFTSGFSLTDRVKGLQKTDGSAGSQWTMYSYGKTFRLKDHGSGDLVQVKDGRMTLMGNKGDGAKKPRFTLKGGDESVPRVTLVSKQGGEEKHISLYNRYGKFGVFSGVMEKSIMHVSADGSELALTTKNVQPHITIESTAKDASAQEVNLKGSDETLKMFHKSKQLGFCTIGKDSKKCNTFLQSSSQGNIVDVISQTDKAEFKIQHQLKGGNTELHLVSQNSVNEKTTTTMYNEGGVLGFRYKPEKGAATKLFSLANTGETTFESKVNVKGHSTFAKDAAFAGNVNVEGVVTMQGKSLSAMMEEMDETKRENMLMRRRMEEMEQESKTMQTRMTEMESATSAMRERMESMMSALQLMQQTTQMSQEA